MGLVPVFPRKKEIFFFLILVKYKYGFCLTGVRIYIILQLKRIFITSLKNPSSRFPVILEKLDCQRGLKDEIALTSLISRGCFNKFSTGSSLGGQKDSILETQGV